MHPDRSVRRLRPVTAVAIRFFHQYIWQSFTPRDYVLDTLSDEVCMRRLLGGLGLGGHVFSNSPGAH